MSFKFAQMTDSHLLAFRQHADLETAEAMFREMARECASHDIDFIIHTGDFCGGASKIDAHRRFKALYESISAELGIPHYLVRGNHDATVNCPDEDYEAVYGRGTYHFHHDGWAFLGIDRYYRCYQHTQHAYAISPETMQRVREELADIDPLTPMIVFLHDDPIGVSRFHRGPELMHTLADFNVKLLLFGHVQASYLGGYRGVPFLTVTGDDRPHDSSCLSYGIVECTEYGQVRTACYPFHTHTPAAPQPTLSPGGRVSLGESWPSYRGPRRNRSIATALPVAAPKLAWQAQLDGGVGLGSPTLHDGRLYVTTLGHGRFEHCATHALDAATGEIQWRTEADGCLEGGLTLDPEKGRGYVGSTAGTLYAVNLADGAFLWRWNNHDNMPIACPCELDPERGLVHCGANWEMYAVEVETGRDRWRGCATSNGFPYMGPGNAAPLVVGDRVFHARTFNAPVQNPLQSVDAATGRGLAEFIPEQHQQMHPRFRQASPILHRDRVWMASRVLIQTRTSGATDVVSTEGYAADISATPAADGDLIVLSYHDQIVAYDLSESDAPKEKWRVVQEPARYHFAGNMPAKYGNHAARGGPLGAHAGVLIGPQAVLVADCGGRVRCLAREDGREIWRLQLPEPVLSAPIVSGQTLFVADYFGGVYAFAW